MDTALPLTDFNLKQAIVKLRRRGYLDAAWVHRHWGDAGLNSLRDAGIKRVNERLVIISRLEAAMTKIAKRGSIDVDWVVQKWGIVGLQELREAGFMQDHKKLYLPARSENDPHNWFPYALGEREKCLNCGRTIKADNPFDIAAASRTECLGD